MATLTSDLRKPLERTVIQARDLAEEAVTAAIQALGVGAAKPPSHLTSDGQKLRRHLRAHGRSLGDRLHPDDRQDTTKLVEEGAYEHWHRMLFARFLAENGLLIHPELGIGVTLSECEDLAAEEGCDAWELAGRYASRMLPQIFRPGDPVLQLRLAPEHQQSLEMLLTSLQPAVFLADDSLGWVYQFWQSVRKDEVNKSEVKIGAEELPAVTQLFTEDYMVDFLLHNSLGAWWVTRHPGQPAPVEFTYLRILEDGTPAAGKLDGWPEHLKNFKVLDPCCGSGHFLVAAFRLLVALRMADERLSAAEAVNAVLTENIFGLELDARCVEIAVFALAIAAWTIPDESGRPLGIQINMPSPAIACCGLKVSTKIEDWAALVPASHPEASRLKEGLKDLHGTFQKAPLLGSLIDPVRQAGNLYAADYDQLHDLLAQALKAESPEASEQALAAKGMMEAARLLGSQYDLVVTNVPYRSSNDLHPQLIEHFDRYYRSARTALETVFLSRCLELCKSTGLACLVLPQDWLFKTSYMMYRKELLSNKKWGLIALLGPKAFQTPMWDFNIQLLIMGNCKPNYGINHQSNPIHGIDATKAKTVNDKIQLLINSEIKTISQSEQLSNPDVRIVFHDLDKSSMLGTYAKSVQGIKSGDDGKVSRFFWELASIIPNWTYYQSTVSETKLFGGLEGVIFWGDGGLGLARRQGNSAWGKLGVAVSQMASMPNAMYLSEKFDSNMTAIVPFNNDDLIPLLAYAMSGDLQREVRKIDSSLKPTNSSFEKIPFDRSKWLKVGTTTFPNGLPRPYSDDPTQWLFHGHPQPAENTLQVAIGRLLGYRWPAENDKGMNLSDEAHAWIAQCEELDDLIDADGIVPIPAMRGEQPAADRLRQILAKSFGEKWSTAKEQEILQAAGLNGKSLETWLRDSFFDQHCKLFLQRPYIWQIWDGLRDGFSVLVNYHKLDRKGLESVTYSYLGDWITRQKEAATRQESGAQGKLEKALELQKKLVAILEGEAPYDIFVRWKPLDQQPIGWEPDLNDGVRLNIRPFMTAGVLRKDPKIDWKKDRGKDVDSAPWFKVFKGERINDHHQSLDEKQKAREKAKPRR